MGRNLQCLYKYFITQFRFMSQALIMQEGTVIRLNARQSKNCTESCPNLLMRATLICSKQKLVTDPSWVNVKYENNTIDHKIS